MHTAGDYAALSYTWGQIAPSIPILVNGSVTMVSENLYLALLHLRKREVTRLWVDAICINQDDFPERASQVSQMKGIYQNAAIVFIWLGESNKLSEQAFDELHGLTELLDWDDVIPRHELDQNMMDENHQKWRAISEILHRPWFRRMWIIQEALSARRAMIVCGKDILDLDLFLKIINSILKAGALRHILAYHPSKELMQVTLKQLEFLVKAKFENVDFITQHKFKPTLLNYLAETRWAEATDPRDKIYGILGLADTTRSLGHREKGRNSTWIPFKPDYNLSKEEVFINVTKAILWTTRSLSVLRFARHMSKNVTGLPSWVPDWSSKEPHAVPEYLSLGPISAGNEQFWRSKWTISSSCRERRPASYDIAQQCQPSFSLGRGNSLTVTGLHFDTIASVTQHTYPRDDIMYTVDPLNKDTTELHELMHQHLESTYEWIEECIHHAANCLPYAAEESTWTSLWRMLNADTTQDKKPIPEGCKTVLESIRTAQSSLAALSSRSGNPDPLTEIALGAAFSNFEHCMSQLPKVGTEYSSWRFATTRNKYMGLVPNEVRVGDVVCVVYGCEMPFVLRKCRRKCYKFVGHCKIQGFSFDEAVVESSYVLPKGKRQIKKDFHFSCVDEAGRRVYTKLKKTRQFTLV
jgi:hypothetical protein